MSRRRLPAVLVGLVGLVASLAAAVAAHAAFEVSGAGSFNRAPVLQPGDYADTIQTTEDLFYAIRLDRGQALSANAILRRDPGEKPVPSAELRLRIYNAARQEIPSAYAVTNLGVRDDVTIETESPAVSDDLTTSAAQVQLAPGTYFVSLNLNDPEDTLGRKENPLEFSLAVAQPTTSNTVVLVYGLLLVAGLFAGLRVANRQARRQAFREARRRARTRERGHDD